MWLKLTARYAEECFYVKAAAIVCLHWHGDGYTVVTYADDEAFVRVKETPEEILAALGVSEFSIVKPPKLAS